MVVALTIEKMIQFYHGNIHDVSHFLKVYAFAKTIGELERLTPQTQETLELAAVVHETLPARFVVKNTAIPTAKSRNWKVLR